MVRQYKDQELLTRVKQLPNFKTIPKGRWILGVRSNEDTPNHFDDKFYEFQGETFIRVVKGTTNPATSILQGGYKQYNIKGAAVVKANKWYYNLWQYGLHKGKMPALLQTGAPITIYRDGDNDTKSEELGQEIEGYFGINYHTNTYDFSDKSIKMTKDQIDGWSAGCQVINEREKYLTQVEWYRHARENDIQESVTYCLINEF
jgi:hypothetical protein